MYIVSHDVGQLNVVAAAGVVKVWALDHGDRTRWAASPNIVVGNDDGSMDAPLQIVFALIDEETALLTRSRTPLVETPQQHRVRRGIELLRAVEAKVPRGGRLVHDGCRPGERQRVDNGVKIVSERLQGRSIERRELILVTRPYMRHAKLIRSNFDLIRTVRREIGLLETVQRSLDRQPMVIVESYRQQHHPRFATVARVERTRLVDIGGQHICPSRGHVLPARVAREALGP